MRRGARSSGVRRTLSIGGNSRIAVYSCGSENGQAAGWCFKRLRTISLVWTMGLVALGLYDRLQPAQEFKALSRFLLQSLRLADQVRYFGQLS